MTNYQPMFHHGPGTYEETARKAQEFAQNKIQSMIDIGRARAFEVINDIQSKIPEDRIVKGTALKFSYEGGSNLTIAHPEHDPESLHSNAFGQVLARAGIPMQFARNLEQRGNGWAHELMAHNLNEIYAHSQDRHLLRSVDGSLRGFLSDKYRRLDSRPLVEAFAGAAAEIGAIPVEGKMLDTKVYLKALVPIVYQPVANEVVAFGVQWENSDFGNGAHNLRTFVLRLWCTNYAIGNEGIRQVHIGRRLTEDVVFSQRTYELDTKTSASMIRDVIKGSLDEDKRNMFLDAIKEAHEERIDPHKAIADLKKRLTKGEVEQVVEAFNSPDVQNMPAGNSRWRLSNALSWIAGKQEDEGKALDFQREAGRLLPQLDTVFQKQAA